MQIPASMVKALRDRTGAGMMECKKALVDVDGILEAAIEHMRKLGQAQADKKASRVAAEGLLAIATDGASALGVMVEVNCETDFVAKEGEFRAFVHDAAQRALEARVSDVQALAQLPLKSAVSAVDRAPVQTIDERRRELVAKIGENVTIRRVALVAGQGDHLGAYSHGGRIGVLVDVSGGDDAVAKDMAMHIAASRPMAVTEAGMPPGSVDREREILKAQVAGSDKPREIQEKIVAGRIAKYLREVTLLGQPFVKDSDVSVEKYLASAGAEVIGFTRYGVGEGIEKQSGNFAAEVMAQVSKSKSE